MVRGGTHEEFVNKFKAKKALKQLYFSKNRQKKSTN